MNYYDILLSAEIREYIDENAIIFLEDVEKYILEEKKLEVTKSQISKTLKSELIKKGKVLAKNNITNRVAQYVIIHDYEVTNDEVVEFVKSKISTASDNAIKISLYRFMKKKGAEIRHKGMSQLVRDYYYDTDNPTLEGACEYVLNKIPNAKLNSISAAWSRIKKNG